MNLIERLPVRTNFPAAGFGRFTPDPSSAGPVETQAETRRTLWRIGAKEAALVKMLNAALRDEMVCTLRYMSHGVLARRLTEPREADRFQRYACEESVHARRLSQRIVQLGGRVDVLAESIAWSGAITLDEGPSLPEMIKSSLSAEAESIDIYCRILDFVSGRDDKTQQLAEDILIEELQHAEELWKWTPGVDCSRGSSDARRN